MRSLQKTVVWMAIVALALGSLAACSQRGQRKPRVIEESSASAAVAEQPSAPADRP